MGSGVKLGLLVDRQPFNLLGIKEMISGQMDLEGQIHLEAGLVHRHRLIRS